MQVAVTCKHGSIDRVVQEYITGKAEKLLNYFERVTAIQITVSFDHEQAKVEILVDAEHKHNFVAAHEADQVSVAFDHALHKMENQIKKYKEKIQDHRRDIPVHELGNDKTE